MPVPEFNQYYNEFLQNFLKGYQYRLTFKSGEGADGVPTCGSMVDPFNPAVSFFFKTSDGKTYKIPFSELSSAKRIEQ